MIHAVMNTFKHSNFFLVLFQILHWTIAEKRLLLNDPSVITDQLARLESYVAYLNTTVKQQAETIENQKTTVQDQANQIKVLDAYNSKYIRFYKLYIIYSSNCRETRYFLKG